MKAVEAECTMTVEKWLENLAVLRDEFAGAGYEYENGLQTQNEPSVGLFYTPLKIVSEIVQNALEPVLFREDGQPKSLEEILQLRFFDPALGCGVFLLEVCFQLTKFLVRHGETCVRIPELIAQNCLFGADIDFRAVSIARQAIRRFCEFSERLEMTNGEQKRCDDLQNSNASSTLSGSFWEQNFVCADSLKLWPSPSAAASNLSASDSSVSDSSALVSEFPVSSFDVVLGNPPFLGGRKIRRVLGDDYFNFLTHEFTTGESGNADLSVYFFRLAERILRPGGICGFLATNSIAEGDSRKTGLDVLLANGARIYRVETFPWPGSASVHVTAVLLQFPKKFDVNKIHPILNGKQVPVIYASLKHLDSSRTAHHFQENEALCYQGCVLAAKGFILTPDEAISLWETAPKYQEVVLPYFTGDDIFSAPDPMAMTPRRYVISFENRSLEEAERDYPLAMKIVRERVLPVRLLARRAAHRERWWQFGDKRPALMKLIQKKRLRKILIQTRHSKYLTPTWVPTDAIYSESTILFPTESPELLAVLNSGVHEAWVRETSSSLGNELRYSPTDCFNTFPLPVFKNADTRFFELRAQLCLRQNCGLTSLMSFFHDENEKKPDFQSLRELKVFNEENIFSAYGWDDLKPVHDFHETPRGVRFELQIPLQEEILERLTQAQNFGFLYT